MKKFLITFFIVISLSGLLVPAVSRADLGDIVVKAITNKVIDNKLKDAAANPKSTPEQVAAANRMRATLSTCGPTNPWQCIIDGIYWVIDIIGNAILSIAAWILWACGVIFNLAIVNFVVEMKARVTDISAIYVVWQAVRDLANMFFIFVLLVIAIQTILDMGGNYKNALRNVILVALFINFSFFFTGVMIDASNLIALQFYKGFAGGNCNTNTDIKIDSATAAADYVKAAANKKDGCMSQNIVNALKLGTIYAPTDSKDGKIATPLTSKDNVGGFLVIVFFGSVLMIVVGGVFLASAILVFYRFVELIFLLMLSPLAFAATAFPGAKEYSGEWWNRLKKQLVFAPVYFMFLWITMKVIQSKVVAANGSFTSGFAGDGATLFGLISSFVIIIAMLIYSLTLAQKLGANASGLKFATSVSKGFQGIIGRNTVGRASSRIANSQTMQNLVAKSPTFGRLVQKQVFDRGAKMTFGDKDKKGGFEQAEKDSEKDKIAQAKRFGPPPLVKARVESKVEQTKVAHKEAAEAHNKGIKNAGASFEKEEKNNAEEGSKINKEFADVESKIKAAEEKSKTSMLPESKSAALEEAAKGKGRLAELEKERKLLNEKRQALIESKKLAIEEATRETKPRLDEALKAKEDAEKEKEEMEKPIKALQEAFAKSNERTYGAATVSKIPYVGKILGGIINAATNYEGRVVESAAVRKALKEKPKKEKLADLYKEVAKEEEEEPAKSEPKGDDKEKKEKEEGETPKS